MDQYFNQLVGGAMGSAFGAAPGGYTMPGPISTLSGMLRGDMGRAGYQDLTGVFPTPTIATNNGITPGGFGNYGGSTAGFGGSAPPLLGALGSIPGPQGGSFSG